MKTAGKAVVGGQGRAKRLPVCPEEVAYLELARTTDLLSRRMAGLLKAEELSSNQYNVLRILRGALDSDSDSDSESESGGLQCGEIGERMITRDPDITRLLDRLEQRGLIARWRDESDRRVVMAKITAEGLKLLGRMDDPVREGHRGQLGHLGPKRLKALVELLQAARADVS